MANFNLNAAGFIIVAMFIATFLGAMAFWRYGHVEEKWSSRLKATSEFAD
jgi:high-affinity nickel-transport protein